MFIHSWCYTDYYWCPQTIYLIKYLWCPSICHRAPGSLTRYRRRLIVVSLRITEPAGSTRLWLSLTRCCCTLILRLCKWPSICLLPHVGNCRWISSTITSNCSSVNSEYIALILRLKSVIRRLTVLTETPKISAMDGTVKRISSILLIWCLGISNLGLPRLSECTAGAWYFLVAELSVSSVTSWIACIRCWRDNSWWASSSLYSWQATTSRYKPVLAVLKLHLYPNQHCSISFADLSHKIQQPWSYVTPLSFGKEAWFTFHTLHKERGVVYSLERLGGAKFSCDCIKFVYHCFYVYFYIIIYSKFNFSHNNFFLT